MAKSLKGQFLIASPYLMDPNFRRSVVLMIHDDSEGSFGLVINRPTDNAVKDLWPNVSESPCATDQSLHIGGPVAGPLMAIHTAEQAAEVEIISGLYFAAQKEHLEHLVAQTEASFRLFVGHAGWSEGQLEREIAEGSWFTLPATVASMFSDESEIWKDAAQQFGEEIVLKALRIPNPPDDVSMN